MRLSVFALAVAGTTSLLAQTPGPAAAADRLEVTATRSVTLSAEEAALNVAISAPASATLEAVVKAAEPVGIRESNLQYITPYFGPPGPLGPPSANRVAYNFLLRIPTAQLSDTLQKLDQLRRALLAAEGGLELVGQNVSGFGASERTRDAARAQLVSDALADARARAEGLARASGLTLGPVVGLTEMQTYPVGPNVPPTLVAGVTLTVRFAVSR